MCLDDHKPDHLIMWMRGTPDEGAARAAVQAFQRTHGIQTPNEARAAATQRVAPVPAGSPGCYWLFDLSQNPPEIVDRGEPIMFRHEETGWPSLDPRGDDVIPKTHAVIDGVQALKLPLEKLKKFPK